MAFGPFFVSFLELLYDFLSQNCSFPVFCEPCVRYDYAASINRNYNKVYIFKDFVHKHKGSFYFPCKNMCVGSYIPQKITFLLLCIVFMHALKICSWIITIGNLVIFLLPMLSWSKCKMERLYNFGCLNLCSLCY